MAFLFVFDGWWRWWSCALKRQEDADGNRTGQGRRHGICIMHKGRNANGSMINMKPKTHDRRLRLRRRDCQVCVTRRQRQRPARPRPLHSRHDPVDFSLLIMLSIWSFYFHLRSYFQQNVSLVFAVDDVFRSCGCSRAHLHTNLMRRPATFWNVTDRLSSWFSEVKNTRYHLNNSSLVHWPYWSINDCGA